MKELPDQPFLTERFEPRGGGIDFLGLRQVNLAMLQEELIPGINNATSDFGMFCLGTWIPWKFRQLCDRNPTSFVLSHYDKFRQAMEVAIAFATRKDSPANEQFGKPRRLIGIRQRFHPPAQMTFKGAKRTGATSLYAAPLYGPALWYIGFIIAHAKARDGSSTGIPYISEDEWTASILSEVETSLAGSEAFGEVVQAEVPPADEQALDDLALHGLHPAFYRQVKPSVKKAFIQKFLRGEGSDPQAERRRLTAALLCETVEQSKFKSPWEDIRASWYTGMLPDGAPLNLRSPQQLEHRARWGVFQSRQIQRSIIEGFLRSFELAVYDGCRSISQILDYWEERSPEELKPVLSATLEELIRAEAAHVTRSRDLLAASRAWHAEVNGNHEYYEDTKPATDEEEVLCRLRMLARWWLRVMLWLKDGVQPRLLGEGGRDRVSVRWFWEWLHDRLATPVRLLLESLYSDIVFAQHIKVALSRFDGEIQRLRFTLGDDGIIPTAEAQGKLGKPPGRMADRLGAFIGLLCDVDVLAEDDDGVLSSGSHRELVEDPGASRATSLGRAHALE
jgi:hypothetical protein